MYHVVTHVRCLAPLTPTPLHYFDGGLVCDHLHLAGGFVPVHHIIKYQQLCFCLLCVIALADMPLMSVWITYQFAKIVGYYLLGTSVIPFWKFRNPTPHQQHCVTQEPLKLILENRSRSFMLPTCHVKFKYSLLHLLGHHIYCFEWNHKNIISNEGACTLEKALDLTAAVPNLLLRSRISLLLLFMLPPLKHFKPMTSGRKPSSNPMS